MMSAASGRHARTRRLLAKPARLAERVLGGGHTRERAILAQWPTWSARTMSALSFGVPED